MDRRFSVFFFLSIFILKLKNSLSNTWGASFIRKKKKKKSLLSNTESFLIFFFKLTMWNITCNKFAHCCRHNSKNFANTKYVNYICNIFQVLFYFHFSIRINIIDMLKVNVKHPQIVRNCWRVHWTILVVFAFAYPNHAMKLFTVMMRWVQLLVSLSNANLIQ